MAVSLVLYALGSSRFYNKPVAYFDFALVDQASGNQLIGGFRVIDYDY
jgi:hypothetical protein